jgi:histidine phosphotransferase ChpT
VISPVGAIVNGLEVLEDEKDESMRGFAEDLIRKSARQASARLQFARIAFGAAGSAGAAIDIGEAAQVAKGFIEDDRVALSIDVPRKLLPKNQVKLFLNLLMIASTTIPRGGQIIASVITDGDGVIFKIATNGTNARIPTHTESLLRGESETGTVDAHSIQPYFAGLIAREASMTVALSVMNGGVLIESYLA